MPTGYCTVDNVRRALQEAGLPGDAEQDRDIVIDAIAAQTNWLERNTKRHWYVSGGISEDTDDLIPTSTNTRDDEHDISTHGGYVVGAYGSSPSKATATTGTVFSSSSSGPQPKEEIRLAFGDLDDDTIPAYTRIRLERKDVDAVNTLNVVNVDGGFDDWVASNDFSGGVGNSHRGEDYWVRINNGGVSELYLDVHAMDDDIPSLSNAVYVDIDYGHEGLPRNIRRGVAFRAAADLTEEAATQIPDNARLRSVDALADELREQATDLLSNDLVDVEDDN